MLCAFRINDLRDLHCPGSNALSGSGHLARSVRSPTPMNSMFLGLIGVFFAFVVLLAVWSRWRRQMGGGWGPTEMSDGSMTTTPTGYPEEMKGHGKKISATDNNAAGM